MTTLIGQPHTRIDGSAKVSGRALYPSDEAVKNPAWAFLLTSAIAKGRIKSFDLDDALRLPGVLDILTHQNVGDQASPPKQQSGGGTTTTEYPNPSWESLGQNAVMAAQWEKLGIAPEKAATIIGTRFDYNFNWTALAFTALIIVAYFVFMFRYSDHEYREVIAERFGDDDPSKTVEPR